MATKPDLIREVRQHLFLGRTVTGITDRSWEVVPGYLFVARRGNRQNGAAYAREAIERGAVGIVAEQKLDLDAPVAVVDDASITLGHLAAAFYGDPSDNLCVIGVTGTNGKTSVTFLTAAALSSAGFAVGSIGTLGVYLGDEPVNPLRLTTPDAVELQRTLRDLAALGATHVVMEVSSHALSQRRTVGCSFDAAVFTNLTRDHADYHADMQSYLAAKGLLFSGLGQQRKPAVAVLNADSSAYAYLRELAKVPIRTFGAAADVSLLDAQSHGLLGTHVRMSVDGRQQEADVRLPGRFNVENFLAAVTAATAVGVEPGTAILGASRLSRVPGRMHILEDGLPCRVVIDYAHNPAGLVQLLRLVRPETPGRLITVFGGRGERDRGKRPLMGSIAAALADHVIVTVDNPRSEDPLQTAEEIAEGARASGAEVTVEVDRYLAIRHALEAARPGDTVTITGKGLEVWDETHDGHAMTDELAVHEIAGDLSQKSHSHRPGQRSS